MMIIIQSIFKNLDNSDLTSVWTLVNSDIKSIRTLANSDLIFDKTLANSDLVFTGSKLTSGQGPN